MSQVSKILSSLDDNGAIDAVKFLGDVGDTDTQILDRILPHCTVDQLMHIEKSSKGRDLTPITNKLWKNFYEKKFGKDATDHVMEKTMQLKKESVSWMRLYEKKVKEIEAKASAIENRIVQNYQKEKARKESRQVKFYDVSSLSTGRKRNFKSSSTGGKRTTTTTTSSSTGRKRNSECTGTTTTTTTKSKVQAKKGTREVVEFCDVPSARMITKRKFEKIGRLAYIENKGRLMAKSREDMIKSIEMKNFIAFQRNKKQKY